MAASIRYTALGDSIGFGLGASCFFGYTQMLGSYLGGIYPGTSVWNFSKILATSSDLLFQLSVKPLVRWIVSKSSLLSICIGGNNLLRGTKNKYTSFDEVRINNGIEIFSRDFQCILNTIRCDIGYSGPILIMTIYNPTSCDDLRYPIFDAYIDRLNSIITNHRLVRRYAYTVVDVYGLFESNPLKNWTHLYDARHNIHPNNEGHFQIFNLHKSVIEL